MSLTERLLGHACGLTCHIINEHGYSADLQDLPFIAHLVNLDPALIPCDQLEVFIEHIPCAERLATCQDACSAATIDVTSLPRRLSRILFSCMAISKVWE